MQLEGAVEGYVLPRWQGRRGTPGRGAPTPGEKKGPRAHLCDVRRAWSEGGALSLLGVQAGSKTGLGGEHST